MNILHTNLIRYEPFPLRTIAVTNLIPYELYPMRTFAYEPLLTNLFLYEPCVYEPSSGYRPIYDTCFVIHVVPTRYL